MLVLTRRATDDDHAAIKIGDDIEVVVLEIRGDQVRLGIKAPATVSVHRREIWLERQQNAEAVQG